MPIEGPLRELGIHDVFQLLDLSRKTGMLRVTSELRHNAGTISFEGGAIVFAEIRSNPHPLGALLLRTGKITEADLERARHAGAPGRRAQARRDPRLARRPHPARARAPGPLPDRRGRVRGHGLARRVLLL